MSTIANNSVVAFHYKLSTPDGEHIDASEEGQPLLILMGHGNIIPGLERQLVGHKVGDSFTATVPPAEGYGEQDPALDLAVPESNFPANMRKKMEPGMRFRGPHPSGEGDDVIFTVVGREDGNILVTGNHELAGQTLVFSIEIAEVRQPTSEELAHGHVHGPGGHHHH